MGIRIKVAACLLWCSVSLGLSTLPGCGPDDGLGKRVPVSGTVTYKGKPVAKGSVSFVPEDPNVGRPATGAIDEGAYQMGTMTTDDGVIPGKYRVTIGASDVDLNQAPPGGGMVDQAVVAKAYRKAKTLIPAKYNDPIKSGLTVEVPGGNYDFDLKD
jgi:hypothetical protein